MCERKLGNIQLLASMPRARARALMAAADLHVGALVPGYGFGRWVPAGDGDALADAVLELRAAPLDERGERGRRAAERLFVREVATRRTCEVFEKVCCRAEPRSAQSRGGAD